MLTRDAILKAVNKRELIITPFNINNLQPNSIDVTLYPVLHIITSKTLDLKQPYKTKRVIIPKSGYVLKPRQLYLGRTVERTHTPWHIPMYEGRSTTGRYFIQSHQTAGFGDIGFDGIWTLEITVQRPTRIYPHMRIGQIGFTEPTGKIISRYKGNYNCGIMKAKPGNI